MKHVDVAIIGASLAGAACVRELTRLGIDAVAFERDAFPRDKVCGGFLSPGAIDLLDELGMADVVRAAGGTTVRSSMIRMRDREVHVELPRPGMGISRRTLDALMGAHPCVHHAAVRDVERTGNRFKVSLEGAEVTARVVVDAAGKLSRFTRRRTVSQFGVQFYETGSRGDVLDFSFFDEGYGGSVSIEGGRTNACFLIDKEGLPGLLGKVEGKGERTPLLSRGGVARSAGVVLAKEIVFLDQHHPSRGCAPAFPSSAEEGSSRVLSIVSPTLSSTVLVTGPLAYDRLPSDYLTIGDAAGMIDPFCGEGMRHALDTGILSARTIATGLQRGDTYTTIRAHYEHEASKRWHGKRRLGAWIRTMLQHPRATSLGFRLKPEFWFRRLWA